MCSNHHPVAPGQKFCAECGAPGIDSGDLHAASITSVQEKWKYRWPLGIAAAVAVIAFGFGSLTSNQSISGVFRLNDNASTLHCEEAEGGYDDIGRGTQVTVTNEDGQVIGTSALSNPKSVSGGCLYEFAVDVEDAAFYSIEVSHRGKLTYSKEELTARDWAVSVTLG